uniref:Uncharacterized protein n=1 Tax=Glossina austeni TaxID=7395 RepID=A0A1A9V1Z4_GLOAU
MLNFTTVPITAVQSIFRGCFKFLFKCRSHRVQNILSGCIICLQSVLDLNVRALHTYFYRELSFGTIAFLGGRFLITIYFKALFGPTGHGKRNIKKDLFTVSLKSSLCSDC